MSFFSISALARDLQPDYTLGGLYCYKGWTGDAAVSAHVILTDRPFLWKRSTDEASTWYKPKKGTKIIDIGIEEKEWEVRINDWEFYKKNKELALRCLRLLNAEEVREYPLKLKKPRYAKRLP